MLAMVLEMEVTKMMWSGVLKLLRDLWLSMSFATDWVRKNGPLRLVLRT